MITNREHIIMIARALYDSGARGANFCTAHLSKEKKIELKNALAFINYIVKITREKNSK